MSSEASSAGAASVTMPTSAQLRALALQAAVPMVGFGIMDQTIMIQAGDLIDSTLGSRLALPTLYAAACGQVSIRVGDLQLPACMSTPLPSPLQSLRS